MVVFDSTFFLLLVHDSVSVPNDPKTRKPWEKGRERVEFLIDRLSEAGTEVLIPTPVLAEAFVRTGSATTEILSKLRSSRVLRVGNFDERAAIEVAMMTGVALATGKKRGKAPTFAPWQKVKIDRQIVAIAKTGGATTLYSDDASLHGLAEAEGITVYGLGDLPLPPVKAQRELFDGAPGQPSPKPSKK